MKNCSKKSFLVILIFSVVSIALSAYEKHVNWFTAENPEIGIQYGNSIPFNKDLRNPNPSADIIFSADFTELKLDTGFKYQFDQFDLTNRIIYMPTFYDSFQTGIGITHHLYRYSDCFTENDLATTVRFSWIKGPVFTFENSAGFLFKFAFIDSLKYYKPIIYNFAYQFELLCKWHIYDFSDVWCALNLQDYYDYPLAISPFFKFGADFILDPNLTVGVDYTLKYIDMFFSAVYLNESILRFTVKVTL